VTTEALPDIRDRLVEKLEIAKYPVADVDVVEIGDDILEIVAKLVATAVDLQRQSGVRHATREVSTAD
jgi:putative Mg2+ transporter-C (MgtC) family protein